MSSAVGPGDPTGPRRLEAAGLVRRIREETGGPELQVLGYCSGGEVGAAQVVDSAGHSFILSATPGDAASRARHARSMAVLERLWSKGHPVPRYEAVIDLGDVVAILQQVVLGMAPAGMSRPLAEALIELQRERAGVMAGDAGAAGPLPLYLCEDGPSFARHGSLRTHSHRTKKLLAWIEATGDRYGDSLAGADAVHFDYHLGNVLVHPDHPDQLTAVVDWDGAASGHGGFDLVTMAFVIGPGIECEVGVRERLWELVGALPESVLLPSWTHLSLRVVDWAIRFRPRDVE